MTATDKLELSPKVAKSTPETEEEEFSIPLDISDIITICQEYNKLGYNIQHQMNDILEMGLEEVLASGSIKLETLPHIKNFLQQIVRNVYFGDATTQARDVIELISCFENKQLEIKSNVSFLN